MKNFQEFKRSSIIIPPNSVSIDKFFEKLCNLIKSWGISEDKINSFKLNIDSLKDFNEKFFTEFIKYVLDIPNNVLWDNIFYIKKIEFTPFLDYHGSVCDDYNRVTKYDILLNTKEYKLESINGLQAYNLRDEIEDFMRRDNLIYNRLKEISKLFPAVE